MSIWSHPLTRWRGCRTARLCACGAVNGATKWCCVTRHAALRLNGRVRDSRSSRSDTMFTEQFWPMKRYSLKNLCVGQHQVKLAGFLVMLLTSFLIFECHGIPPRAVVEAA